MSLSSRQATAFAVEVVPLDLLASSQVAAKYTYALTGLKHKVDV